MKTQRVLVIDGNPKALERHSGMLSEDSYTVLKAGGFAEAAGILKKHRGNAVVLTELSVNGKCGIAFMKDTLKEYPSLPFTFFVPTASAKTAIELLKEGAYDLLRKPVSKEVLCRFVAGSTQRMLELREKERLEKALRKRYLRSQENLREARTLSSFKGFLISMAAHDFRTILTVLDGYLQFTREQCRECPVSGREGMMHRASRTVERLQRMANMLLDYEAAESGKIRAEIRPVPLGDVLRECIAFYKPYAEQKGIDLSLNWDGAEIDVKSDRQIIMEILDNLVYNALKYTPAGGGILLSGTEGTGFVTVTVSDTGPGIQEDMLEKIFCLEDLMSSQGSSARMRLGMTICKYLVEAQNGKIQVNSVFGKGTQVSFSIPSL